MKAFAYLDGVTGARLTLARLGRAELVPAKHAALFQRASASAGPDVRDHVGTLVGAAGGAILWKNHRVLGAIAGASLGRNVPALLNASTRKLAFANMGATKVAIVGSLLYKSSPVTGFGLGWLLGNAIVYFGKYR